MSKKFLILLIGIFLISLVSAYTYSSTYNSFNYNYGTDVPFKQFDEEMCQAGQDFVIQVAPFGCEPAVVRSDLLEEQNQPVFCQLSATKINPLIDVQAIDYISFQGNYPKEVSGIGFHPAQAAIKTSSSTLLNSPVLNNIGYAVIVLRQQKNESSFTNCEKSKFLGLNTGEVCWVNGTLTASIRYNIKNAFGIGRANYYLPEIQDDEWSQQMNNYEFWNGKGFVRAQGISTDSATISVYEDEFDKIASFDLEKGQTSEMTYIPGYYCMAGVQVRLDGLENPDTRAKLKVNDDVVEVAEGEMFLDNKCRVTRLENKGIVQSVSINCQTDEGRENFVLKTSPKIKLDINGEEKDYELGDYLYTTDDKSVYLGYIGTTGNSKELGDVYIYTFAMPENVGNKLSDDKLAGIARVVNRLEYSKISGNKVWDAAANVGKLFSGASANLFGNIFLGENYKRLAYSDKGLEFGGKKLKIVNFAGAVDVAFTDKNLKSAMKDYQDIMDKFSKETQSADDKITFGEKALFEKIALADGTGQKKTMLDFCKEFKEKYPESTLNSEVNKKCKDEARASSSEISSRDISTEGIVKTISFEGIYEPTPDEYSAEIHVGGNKLDDTFTFTKNQITYLDDASEEYIQLIDLRDDSATINFYVKSSTNIEALGKALFSSGSKTLKLGETVSVGGGYTFTLGKVNLKKVAKVSVIPNIKYAGTEANFSFKIGIEKRAIQLSPEKISEKLVSINKTIAKWNETNTQLGKVVKGMKAACLATGSYMTVKNFFTNMGGKATARQEVMSSDDGWYDLCKACLIGSTNCKLDKTYSSVDDCLLKNNDAIEADVNQVSQIMGSQGEITKDNIEERLNAIKNKLGTLDADVLESLTKAGYGANKITLKQARDLERLQTIISASSSSEELKAIAEKEKSKILADIKANSQNYALYNSLQEEMKTSGIKLGVGAYGNKDAIQGEYSGGTISATQIVPKTNLKERDEKGNLINYPAEVITYSGKKYLVILSGSGSTYIIEKVFQYQGTSGSTILVGGEDSVIPTKFSKFIKYDEGSYSHPIKEEDRVVRFFETEPYKGYPAVVPIDVNKGWYAATQQNIGGNLKAYDDSGRVVSFKLCNVGENGKVEYYSGIGDDICQGFDLTTAQIYAPFPGLDPGKTKDLVGKAINAIREAQNAYQRGNVKAGDKITIGGQKIKVGAPAADVPGIQCQDFMSPKDCWKLFNVCDPVVCPSSRCDLGGAYPVKDVIQSGIIGSIALCAPNYKEGIYMPVCLTGVHAGIDSLISVFKNYQDCLQYSLDTGEQVGVCDEIHSIYLCELFWRQAGPITKLLIPKLIGKISGQGTRGGGEYMSVLDAYTKAGESVNYLVQYYGKNSYQSFNARSTEEVGTEVCKAFPSLVYGGNFIDKLIEPDSPTQYSAWFSEIPFTSATVPPISQYKVFYHIYAGKDRGAYYQVYLKSPSGTSFYYDNPMRIIATGYIPRGDYASETRDFTAPSGYKELCVNVNGQDECGFGKVSTEFAIDYMNDLYVKDQTMNTEIKTEKKCVSGSVSLYGFTTSPNLEEGANKALNPSLASLGITRICSTANPGKGTNADWENNKSRWKDVGYCGNEKMRCWLDTDSVKKIVQSNYTENQILGEAAESNLERLKSERNYIDFEKEKEKIENFDNEDEKIVYITDTLIGRAFLNNEKAWLLLTRGNAFGEIAKNAYQGLVYTQEQIDAARAKEEISQTTIYPAFEFQDGRMLEKNLWYIYEGGIWKWATSENDIISGRGASVEKYESIKSDYNKIFARSLMDKDYEEGLKLLIKRTTDNLEGGWFSTTLWTERIDLSNDGIFSVKHTTKSGSVDVWLKFEGGKWKFSKTSILYFDISSTAGSEAFSQLEKSNQNLVYDLENAGFDDGAIIIFAMNTKTDKSGTDRREVDYNFKSRTEKEVIQLMDEIKNKNVAGRTCSCGSDCSSYARFIAAASVKYNIPDPLLLLSIMMQESRCDKTSVSSSSVGLMQINLIHCGNPVVSPYGGKIARNYGLPGDEAECKNLLLTNHEKNIFVGAQILGEMYSANRDGKQFTDACKEENKQIVYYNWEAAVRGYNGWGCNKNFPEQDNFVEEVMARYKELSALVNPLAPVSSH